MEEQVAQAIAQGSLGQPGWEFATSDPAKTGGFGQQEHPEEPAAECKRKKEGDNWREVTSERSW